LLHIHIPASDLTRRRRAVTPLTRPQLVHSTDVGLANIVADRVFDNDHDGRRSVRDAFMRTLHELLHERSLELSADLIGAANRHE
jgi:hypothetical protein